VNQKFVDSQIAHRLCAFVRSCHIHDFNSKFCNKKIYILLTWLEKSHVLVWHTSKRYIQELVEILANL